jgi:hypothetical protein
VCEHSGDRFSVGGKAKNPDGTLIQCVLVNGNATWQNIERPKKNYRKAASLSPAK